MPTQAEHRAKAESNELHSANHAHRDGHVNRLAALKPLYPDYRRLKDDSQAARYGVRLLAGDDVAKARECMLRIKEHVLGLL